MEPLVAITETVDVVAEIGNTSEPQPVHRLVASDMRAKRRQAPTQMIGQIALHESQREAGGGRQIAMRSDYADCGLDGRGYIRTAARAKASSQYGYGQHQHLQATSLSPAKATQRNRQRRARKQCAGAGTGGFLHWSGGDRKC